MTRSQQRQAMLLLLLAIVPSGCSIAHLMGPSIPEYQPPSDAEIQRMTQRMMGKAPKRNVPVTTDGVQVVFQTGHTAAVSAVAVSPNGRYLVSAAADATVKIWDVASGQEVRTLTGFDLMGARMLAFSSDGARVVTVEMLAEPKVFDVASGLELYGNSALPSIGAVASADGRLAAYKKVADRSLTVWDLMANRLIWTLPDSDSQSAVAMSADGRMLLTSKVDTNTSLFSFSPSLPQTKRELIVWDVPAKKQRRVLPIAVQEGGTPKISPDGRYLVNEGVDRSLKIYDLENGRLLHTITSGLSAMSGMTNTLTFSPDGNTIALSTSEGTTKLWGMPGGRPLATLQGSAVNFSSDGHTLVMGAATGGAPFLHDLATGKETHLAGGATGIADLALVADGRSVVAGMDGGSAKLWDLTTGQIVRTFDCPGGTAVHSVAVSGIAPVLATGCFDGSAWLWELATGLQIRNLTPPLTDGHARAVVRMSRDGRTLALGVQEQLSLWDVASGKELHHVTLTRAAAPKLRGGPSAAYGGMDPTIQDMMRERDNENVQPMDPKMMEMAHWIDQLAMHPNGQLVAVARQDELSLWDMKTGRLVRRIGEAGAGPLGGQMAPTNPRGAMTPGASGSTMGSMLSQLGLPGGQGSRSGLGGLFGMGGAEQPPQLMLMGDPSELFRMAVNGTAGTRSLVFSPDGRALLTVSTTGKHVWDVATGQEIRTAKATTQAGFNPMSMLENIEMSKAEGIAVSADGRLGARGHGQVINIWDIASGKDLFELIGHTSDIKALAFAPNGRALVSGGGDGAIRVWNLQTGKELVSLVSLGHNDFVAVTPDQYYRASKSRIKGVAFRVKNQLYPFEQFDLRFNRPDIVLQRLGWAAPDIVQSYRLAYDKRLRKMGLTEQMLGSDFHLPEVEVLTKDIPVSTNTPTLTLQVNASDSKYPLDRYHVFVNDIPIYGTTGLPFSTKQTQPYTQDLLIPLVTGRNKIQVSVLNQQGVESLRQTVYTTSTAQTAPPDVYVLAIGVSEYKDKAYNLRYAAKDALDLAGAYQSIERRAGTQGKIHILNLTDQKATRPEILKAKDWLKQSKINDLVVVFAAGHGMTDEQSNYYFGTHDIDPKHPATNGLPYEEFELLLDGIPALQKLLLLDTCFSGEIEKDQAVVVAKAETGGAGTVKMRAFKAARGITVVADAGEANSGTPTAPRLSNEMVKFQQDWFADLRRGTGAAVISSSSGNEYSLEGEQWKNGVFTYALLNGLKNRGADTNKDQTITVSELQSYVIDQVRKLTEGGQNPTVRRENLEYDFAVY